MEQHEYDLRAELASRFWASIAECRRCGYPPNRFEEMLKTTDPVHLAMKLLISGELQDGLKTLARMGRLDLSLESIVLEVQFKPLFPERYLQAAQWRLAHVKQLY